MKILVLNCGSSSIKFQLINKENEQLLAEGIVERIGEELSLFTYKSEPYTVKKSEVVIADHEQGLKDIIDLLLDAEKGCIASPSEIDAVGHRVVHAGEYYSGSVYIDDDVVRALKDCIHLAPLHNPANIKGIEAVYKYLPGTPQCGVFDTAFHQTMPEKAYLYAIPYELYVEHKIRKYGFHGTSHKYVALKAAEFIGKPITELKIITCHVGNGASITAIDKGNSVDTSMGLTPLEGLVMGTRSGDIDSAIPLFLQENLKMSVTEVSNLLNKKSGMLGLSQLSNDMRVIEDAIVKDNDPRAVRAHDVYAYRIKKYIGAYVAAMNGIDALVFTGGVGENMPILRALVCEDMDYLGIKVDAKANQQWVSGTLDISAPDSRAKVLKVQTDEEMMIAIETEKIINSIRKEDC